MIRTRPFTLGLAVGASVGVGVVLGIQRIVHSARVRQRLHAEHLIDGVPPPDPMIEWTVERESSHALIELESELPDFSQESQRW